MKNKHAVELGKMSTKKKAEAARKNGLKGGRPKVCLACKYKDSRMHTCTNFR